MPENPGGRHGDEPSPEDVFAGRTSWSGPAVPPPATIPEVNVYLTDADVEKSALATKGVRAALSIITGAPVNSVAAGAVFDKFFEGERPLLLGWAPNEATAREAAEAALTASNQTVGIGIGLTDADIAQIKAEHAHMDSNPEPSENAPMPAEVPVDPDPPADWAPTTRAAKLALNLLAQHDGVPHAAYTWARIMGENDPDGPWQDVRWLMLAAFPMRSA